MLITRGSISKAMMPGVNRWFGLEYNRYPPEFVEIFKVMQSQKMFEEEVNIHGIGMGAVIPEGTDVTFDTASIGGVARTQHVRYGRGFKISHEAIVDNQYPQLMQAMAESMGRAMRQLKETVGANILNRAANSSYTMWDGLSLCNTAHLLSKGGTYANTLSVATPLSETSLEQMLVNISKFVDDSSINIAARGVKLVVPPELVFEAQRILKSPLKYDTAENAINAMNNMGMLPGGVVLNHYLSSTSRHFVLTDVPGALVHYEREPVNIDNQTEFSSDAILYKITERYSFNMIDGRGIYGNGE